MILSPKITDIEGTKHINKTEIIDLLLESIMFANRYLIKKIMPTDWSILLTKG